MSRAGAPAGLRRPPAPASVPLGPAPLARRFWVLLALGSLALSAGYAALVLGSATWAQVRQLDALFPYYGWHIRLFSSAAWHQAQAGMATLAGGLGLGWLALGPASRRGRRELAATGAEARQLARRLRQQWRGLGRAERRFFNAHLLVLSAARLGLSLTLPWADDAVSFEFFVRQRLLAVAAYYPLPNNHILSNTLAWGFYQLHHGFWWAMRLPVLLTSTLGTLLLFAGLWRRLGYWPALLAAGAMSWVQLSLAHAASGRGYWLVVMATATLFFSLLALLDEGADARPPARRLAWLGLVGAGGLGGYAVPTFAYGLASAWGWLGLRALLARRWRRLGELLAMGTVVGVGALLLYTPTLYVSGPAALLANSYVRRLAVGEFWRGLPAHAWFTEGYLVGQRHVGAGLTLLGLGLFAALWRRVRAGQVAPALARQVRQVGLPALWFVGFPYVLLLGQRVLPPERTWLYKSWFFFILVALVLAGWRWQRPARRRLLALGVGLFGLYQVAGQARLTYNAYHQRDDHRAVYRWLRAHPQAGPVLIPDLYLWGWLRFQTHIDQPDQPWLPDQQPRPGVAYAYAVTRVGAPPLPGAGAVVFADGQLLISRYAAPAGTAAR